MSKQRFEVGDEVEAVRQPDSCVWVPAVVAEVREDESLPYLLDGEAWGASGALRSKDEVRPKSEWPKTAASFIDGYLMSKRLHSQLEPSGISEIKGLLAIQNAILREVVERLDAIAGRLEHE